MLMRNPEIFLSWIKLIWKSVILHIYIIVDVVASGENSFRGLAVQSRASTSQFSGNAAFQGGFENSESDSDWQLITCNMVNIASVFIISTYTVNHCILCMHKLLIYIILSPNSFVLPLCHNFLYIVLFTQKLLQKVTFHKNYENFCTKMNNYLQNITSI